VRSTGEQVTVLISQQYLCTAGLGLLLFLIRSGEGSFVYSGSLNPRKSIFTVTSGNGYFIVTQHPMRFGRSACNCRRGMVREALETVPPPSFLPGVLGIMVLSNVTLLVRPALAVYTGHASLVWFIPARLEYPMSTPCGWSPRYPNRSTVHPVAVRSSRESARS